MDGTGHRQEGKSWSNGNVRKQIYAVDRWPPFRCADDLNMIFTCDAFAPRFRTSRTTLVNIRRQV
jgi:hypothetical protein